MTSHCDNDDGNIYWCNDINTGASSWKIKPLNVKLSIFHQIYVANTAQLVKLESRRLFGKKNSDWSKSLWHWITFCEKKKSGVQARKGSKIVFSLGYIVIQVLGSCILFLEQTPVMTVSLITFIFDLKAKRNWHEWTSDWQWRLP